MFPFGSYPARDRSCQILKLVEKCPSLKIIVLTDEVTATQQKDFQAVTAGRGLKLSSYVQTRKEVRTLCCCSEY
jgi:hypothetical protein